MSTRVPVSTYRLQLGPDLTFADAVGLLDHLVNLGITDLYLSPILTAAPGSTHGYDVVDHTTISPVLGGRAGFEQLATQAHSRGLGVIVDVVPNHMAVPTPASHNRVLWDVLAHGPASQYAGWFDVDFSETDQVLMPVLGERIGTALASGALRVERVDEPEAFLTPDQPVLCYYEHRFPIREGTADLPLEELLERQHYRLAYWRVASEELNYRRFFDVGSLVGLRVEREEVFQATHALILELVTAGLIDGLRIDHPDGLADPGEYFRRLHQASGGVWTVAEKILEPHEHLPAGWSVAGTTGYDAAWRIGQVLTEQSGALPLGGLMATLTPDALGTLPALITESKREIATGSLHAEVHRLAALIAEICADDIRLRDHTLGAITDCVRELVVACDRYRAYVRPGEVLDAATAHLVQDWAAQAATQLEEERHDTLAVVTALVLGQEAGSAGRRGEQRRDEVIVRFQQVCGAVMAKGVEDTAFYRWTHLTSLCEVGGSPQTFAIEPDELHAWCTRTQQLYPHTLTALSTHDAKRGEDVRARIGAISEHAHEWVELVRRLQQITAEARPVELPGRTENLLWQTLAGTWTTDGPLAADRLTAYLVKASREAKDWTTWVSPDVDGEAALVAYAHHVLGSPEVAEAMTAWVERTAETVRVATLGARALQLTVPGVADTYQGTEVTTVALVDPDNRRPVDHGPITTALERLDAGAGPWDLASEKLRMTAALLRLRRRRPEAFVGDEAGYRVLRTSTGHAVAFARTVAEQAQVVTVVTRRLQQLRSVGGWGEHSLVLPEGRWLDVVGGAEHGDGEVPLAELLRSGPVAVLEQVQQG